MASTDRDAHQMTRAQQRQGKRKTVAACAPAPRSEKTFRLVHRQPHGDGDGQARRRQRAIDHRHQAFARFGIAPPRASEPASQHFGARHAFGIGQVGIASPRPGAAEW